MQEHDAGGEPVAELVAETLEVFHITRRDGRRGLYLNVGDASAVVLDDQVDRGTIAISPVPDRRLSL